MSTLKLDRDELVRVEDNVPRESGIEPGPCQRAVSPVNLQGETHGSTGRDGGSVDAIVE